MSLSSDKVKCNHCKDGKVYTKKNLKVHTTRQHFGEKESFTAVHSVDIRTFTACAEPKSKYIKKTNDETADTQSPESSESRTGESHLTDSFDFDSILTKLDDLSVKVDRLEKVREKNIIINTADLSYLVTKNVNELLAACRSIGMILSFFPCFKIQEGSAKGLQCTACESVLRYDFELGVEFEKSEYIPPSFSHLKESVKRHVQSGVHLSNLERKDKLSKEQQILMKDAKIAAINCASAAYLGFKFGLSNTFYEYAVSEIYSSGGSVGLKNHSKEFSRKFATPMYNVLRSSFISYLTNNRYPFGLIADKMTAKHRKRHIIGVRVPIWDMNISKINRDIYVRHSAIGYGSGKAMVEHLLNNLESFGIPMPYIKENLVGMAMDGQYTCLNIESHMSDILCKNVNLSWDPMHCIELANKDAKKASETKVIDETINIIQETFTTFNYGNNFELLFSEKQLCETFYAPKLFKGMKFVAYSSTVFNSFISDFKALVSCLDKIKEDHNLKEKLLNVEFLFNMLFLSDITELICSASKLVQISNNLPWDYSDSIQHAFDQIFIMFDELNTIKTNLENDQENVISLINSLSKSNFKNLRSAVEIFQKNTYQGIGISNHSAGPQTRERVREASPTITGVFSRMLEFGSRYVAALRDNLVSRFDCKTLRYCKKFKILLDTSYLFYPRSNHPIDEPWEDFETFSKFVKEIPFISNSNEDQRDLLFQIRIMRKELLVIVEQLRQSCNIDQFESKHVLKSTFSRFNSPDFSTIRYFMSSVVAFPISEAIVESWGSVIDDVIADKIAFKESEDSSVADYTEKIVFMKLVGPAAGAQYNRKLFKRALVMMYGGTDFAKHFLSKSRIGYTSKVVEKITNGKNEDFIFW